MVSRLPAELILMTCQYLSYRQTEKLAKSNRRLTRTIRRYLPNALEPKIRLKQLTIISGFASLAKATLINLHQTWFRSDKDISRKINFSFFKYKLANIIVFDKNNDFDQNLTLNFRFEIYSQTHLDYKLNVEIMQDIPEQFLATNHLQYKWTFRDFPFEIFICQYHWNYLKILHVDFS